MLTTRLAMGTALVLLTLGVLVGDCYLAPWFPFLFVFQFGLTLACCHELAKLLGPQRAPQRAVCYTGVVCMVLANWVVHHPGFRGDAWTALAGIQAGFLLIVFLYEM